MKLTITDNEFLIIRDMIHDKTGIYLGENKKYLIETRLSHLVHEHNCKTFADFYLKLKQSARTSVLITSVVDAITTNETLWFRDTHPFNILEKKVLPDINERLNASGQREVRIWSAACSTGQEPYSIAMLILEMCERKALNLGFHQYVNILATDISTKAIADAEYGRFNSIAIGRGLPDYYLTKYFKREENYWSVLPHVRSLVKFKNFNLKDPVAGLMGPFDIIFIRNVMIYFSDQFKKELLRRVESVLKPGGIVMLGTGESLASYSNRFDLLNHEGGIYYQLQM